MSRIAYALIFLALFIPAALRSNTGNDYLKYVDFMHLIRSNAYVPTETGFNTFVRAVYAASGYENYLLVFALLSAMTIALFLAAVRDQSVDFFLSFFLFMTLGYYFQSYSTVRYYFALAIVIYSLKFFLNREYVPFLLLVLLAAGFHKSVLVVLILYPLALIPWNAVIYLCGAALCAAFAAFPDFWLKVVVKLYPSYEDTEYLSGSGFNPKYTGKRFPHPIRRNGFIYIRPSSRSRSTHSARFCRLSRASDITSRCRRFSIFRFFCGNCRTERGRCSPDL